jgi:uncharacterized protein
MGTWGPLAAADVPLSTGSLPFEERPTAQRQRHDHFCHRSGRLMPENQYHEPPDELSAETRTFARMITSLVEEAEAIGWYEQRMSLEPDVQAKAIMQNAQEEEFKHFAMDLEFLLRRLPKWRVACKGVLFQDGDIVELGERAEDAEHDAE